MGSTNVFCKKKWRLSRCCRRRKLVFNAILTDPSALQHAWENERWLFSFSWIKHGCFVFFHNFFSTKHFIEKESWDARNKANGNGKRVCLEYPGKEFPSLKLCIIHPDYARFCIICCNNGVFTGGVWQGSVLKARTLIPCNQKREQINGLLVSTLSNETQIMMDKTFFFPLLSC